MTDEDIPIEPPETEMETEKETTPNDPRGLTSTGRALGLRHLRIHRGVVLAIYAVAATIAYLVFRQPETTESLIVVLATGAIVATFGAAISALGAVFERDLIERVSLDVDILFRDILEQEPAWRRWPFLARQERLDLPNDEIHISDLRNPIVPFDVGTHILRVDLPTVLCDFFDLPLWRNVLNMMRFRRGFRATSSRRERGVRSDETGMTPTQELFAYDCVLDIWRSILTFRLARYTIHFGTALIFASVVAVVVSIVLPIR